MIGGPQGTITIQQLFRLLMARDQERIVDTDEEDEDAGPGEDEQSEIKQEEGQSRTMA